ncbi:MAG: carboxyl transferase domain-containing protein [Pseudomonadales bacterium]|jgi:acetyl-CoA carboxylase carboxyltransferase component|nr:carboxyl transferase domain-containing protein [Pseudomonadales bacterium]MDP6470939.1 carboxyl transferase domain-containing protein [Pseudomonadales bacterium]MDP6825876.1 carboxyl transferase domain-containing protein [Pseudomonadales bacterium]MDP6972844.1 carboxyl transferase domain-containing protein [Pseudomonadales bacterium]
MSWEKEVRELERRRQLAKQQGGRDGIARQHAKGRLTIRERVDALLDEGSFREQGQATAIPDYDDNDELLGFVPANYVVGFGKIDGRRVVVGGEDFTLKGGSPNAAGLRKSVYAEHLASQYRVPFVRMLEGGGGSVKGGGRKGGTVGEPVFSEPRFKIIADVMSEVPVISGAMGAVAGFPAGRLVASHFSVMTRHTAQVLIGGPALVERALGVRLTKDELGGAEIHASSGIIDNLAEDEYDAFRQMRQFLSYLPSNVFERTKRLPCNDTRERMEQDLLSAVPREANTPFDMRAILEMVFDLGSFFEMAPYYGPSQICGFARLDGQPVGVLANDNNHYAGAMTAEAAQKYRRFVETCDTFHVPVVNFVDQPGFMIGPEAEKNGTIRYGMAAVAAAAQATIPWAVIQVHKGFGVATAAHYAPGSYVLAWPSVESGALPLEGGVAVAFHREIAAAGDPDAKRKQLEDGLRQARSPFPRAESFAVHELIDPRETRPMLCEWVDWIQTQLDQLTGQVRFGMRP